MKIIELLRFKIPYSVISGASNTLYAILLGLVFKSMFVFSPIENQGNTDGFNLSFLLASTDLIFSIMVFSYFLFDWFTTVVVSRYLSQTSEVQHQEGNEVEHWVLFLIVVFSLFLATTVLFSLGATDKKYLLFGAYAFIVPFWDYYLFSSERLPTKETKIRGLYLICSFCPRGIIGALLLLASVLMIIFHKNFLIGIVQVLVTLYVLLKVIRYFIIIWLINFWSGFESRNKNSIQAPKITC